MTKKEFLQAKALLDGFINFTPLERKKLMYEEYLIKVTLRNEKLLLQLQEKHGLYDKDGNEKKYLRFMEKRDSFRNYIDTIFPSEVLLLLLTTKYAHLFINPTVEQLGDLLGVNSARATNIENKLQAKLKATRVNSNKDLVHSLKQTIEELMFTSYHEELEPKDNK